MVKVVDNPIETSYEDAMTKYDGYCVGMQIIDACDTCIFRVKVMLYSDKVPTEEFCDLEEELGVNFVEWAFTEDRHFYTREEHEKMEAEYKNSSAYRETEARRIRGRAFMILAYFAFYFETANTIKVYDLRNINQFTLLSVEDGDIILNESTMSDADKHKSLSIIERNKQDLVEGIKKWSETEHDAGYIHQY